MNAAELFKKHSHSTYIESEEGFHRVMMLDDFAAAIQEATAQARREALDEAAECCDDIAADYAREYYLDYAAGADRCVEAIRALAEQPQEGGK